MFGVKSSLVVDTTLVDDKAAAEELGFQSAPYHLLERDYVLQTVEQAEAERRKTLASYYATRDSC